MSDSARRAPSAAEVREVLGFVPLMEVYFRRAHTEMPPELRRLFTQHTLTARHGAVLPHLMVEGALSVGEVAARLGVTLPTASELVGDLSRAGLVRRAEDPDNRRRVLVSLADRHRAKVERFLAGRAEPLLRVLDGLAPRDRAGFVAGLTAWAREVRSWW